MILCRDPSAGHARYVCPGCGFDRCVPFSCKTRFCPSCGKVNARILRVDHWVADIARDLYDVPHLHVTCSALDFISRMVPHIPPKGMQTVRYSSISHYPRLVPGDPPGYNR